MPGKKDTKTGGFPIPTIMDIEKENRENPECWNEIRLLNIGGYWRAYEWSGWLMCKVISQMMKQRHPDDEFVELKASKSFAKNINGEYIFVGCQRTSFEKYLPEEIVISQDPVANNRLNVKIKLPEVFSSFDYDKILGMYMDWKQKTPLAEKDDNDTYGDNRQNANTYVSSANNRHQGFISTTTALLTKILSFKTSRHTPVEAMKFLEEIQDDITNIL